MLGVATPSGGGALIQDVVHHGGQLLGQHLVAGGGRVDGVLPPQIQNSVNIHILVVESQRVGGVEGLDVLDPPQEDRVVDPAVDVPDPLDHAVDVAVRVSVGHMAWVVAALGDQVSGHRSHCDGCNLNSQPRL